MTMLLLGKIPHLNAVYIRGVTCLYIMQINKRINLEGVYHVRCMAHISQGWNLFYGHIWHHKHYIIGGSEFST